MLVAPFQLDELKKIVSGEIGDLEIDISNSKIKNQSLLTYIYNLNLADPKINHKSAELKDRRDLFMSYLTHKTIVNVSGFSEAYLKFLFKLKEIKDLDTDALEILQQSIFTDDEVEYLLDNDPALRELIEHSAFLLDGIVIHLILNINDTILDASNDFGKIGVVSDPLWIGHTWINLLEHPVFNVHYYSKMPELTELVYFPYQYSEPIYKGKPLLDYLNKSNLINSLFEMSVDGVKGQPL
jgi:hypothetical protein